MSDDRAPTTPSLLDIYLALSHIGEAAGPLAPLAGEAHEETPRLHIARTTVGEWRVFMRPDLPPEVRERLAALAPVTLFSDYARVASILAQRAPDDPAVTEQLDNGLWLGRTLLFPDDLPDVLDVLQHDAMPEQSPRAFGEMVRLTPAPDGRDYYGAPAPGGSALRPAIAPPDEPTPAPEVFPGEQFAALADGIVVATCESARESALAAEAWVRTLPAARGRGYATRVTAAWALDVRRRGKTPFYSYHRANLASAGVARALGLIHFLEDVGYL